MDAPSILIASTSICSMAQTVYIDGFNYQLDPETRNAIALGAPWQDDDLLVAGVLTIPAFVKYKEHDYYVTEIGDYVFAYWDAVTWVNLPNTVMTIGKRAFYACVNVKMFAGADNVLTTIKDGAFSHCYSITGFFLPPSLEQLGDHAFENCVNLLTIDFSNTLLVDIPYGVCRGCIKLNTVSMSGDGTIPGVTGIRRINADAFEGCDLSMISFPHSLLHIGSEAFKGCPLKIIECQFDDPFKINVDVFDVYETATLFVPKGTMDRFQKVSSWNLFWNVKESENTSITNPQTSSTESNNMMLFYDMNGRKYNSYRKGLNIIKSKEGKTKKVLSK